MMDARRISAAVAIALIAAGCGNRKAATKPDASATPSATASATGPAATGQPTGAAPAGGQTSKAPPAAPGAPLQQGALQPTTPGNYSYAESGQTTFNCGTPQTQAPPSPTTLRIDAANGNRQRGVRDRRRANGQGETTTSDFEFRADGIYLAYLHQQQTTPVGTDTAEFEPNPPVLVMPRNPSAGQSWQFTLTTKDGRSRADVSNTVEVPSEPVTLGNGSTALASRLKRNSHITGTSSLGQLDITENASVWVSVDNRLILKQISDGSGTVGLCTLSEHIEELLNSLSPS